MPNSYVLPGRLREQVSDMEESAPGIHDLEDGTVRGPVMVFNGIMLHAEDCDDFDARDVEEVR